ncbi:M81 family metallopeptidase [Blastopirellula sp. JC732]|uniref:M81 family metallopeptidase n=1 Tax=Blastopirellula sediminis TaxID=2894196 RepID=A0A9X1MRL4_9BACT|nr:M81 family metallopeptidase [Blastopirellula sediminis]MCC9605560.1 M81 family metallopeptidase [Blastopirellula sediminis]MCC9631140.1 M81 family metallopeptidase [Blastopirellula sediminis]
MRVGIISLLHESNTFVTAPTTLDNFRRDVLLVGHEILPHFETAHHEIGGFITGLRDAGIEPVGVFAARALPSGVITADTFDELVECMLDHLEHHQPLDGLLIAPHGATVAENHPDADGYWMQAVREAFGPDKPIIGTLDPHANLSPQMVKATDALFAYRTNPHVDQADRGREAALLMARTLRGEVRPRQAASFPPLAINIERQCSEEQPCREYAAWVEEVRQRPGILGASLFYGFPYSDVAEMGTAMLCIADGDAALAASTADELAHKMWDDRERTLGTFLSVHEAIDKALACEGPVCLLDMGDNVGAGSPADGTTIAQALVDRNVERAFVAICDPEAVAAATAAGVGQTVALEIGAKLDRLHGDPLRVTCQVISLHEGRFAEEKPRHGGKTEYDMGPTAIVRTKSGLTLQLTSERTAPWSLRQLTYCNLAPTDFQIIVAKGVNAPLAAYAAVCPQFFRVDTPGVTTANLSRLQYAHRRSGMYPFERDAVWR